MTSDTSPPPDRSTDASSAGTSAGANPAASTGPDDRAPDTPASSGPSETPGISGWARPAVWIATAGGLGYAPVASGTFGSAGAVLLFWGLSGLSLPLYALTVVTLSVLGIWASDRAEVLFDRKDDGRIVIDEVAGQLITLTPVLVLAHSALARLELSALGPDGVGGAFAVGQMQWWGLVVTAFVVFRVLDIWKPGPIRWAERNFSGGLGVMADDLLAGVFGGVLMTLPCYALLLQASGALVEGLAAAEGVLP